MEWQVTKHFQYAQPHCRLICMSVAILFCALPAHAQADQILSPIGGSGGGQYIARCPQGELLAGFDLRTGDDVDAIRPLCVSVHGPAETGPVNAYSSQFGGNGGGPRRIVCPANAPAVIDIDIGVEGVEHVIVNSIHLFCGLAIANQLPDPNPTVIFDGPPAASPADPILFKTGASLTSYNDTQRCPAGLVAVGINGRSGVWLDAVGLICGVSPVASQAKTPPTTKPPIALGRVKTFNKPVIASANNPGNSALAAVIASQALPKDDPPICAAARSARARNSPAAAGLEGQCAAARMNTLVQPPIVQSPGNSDHTTAPPLWDGGQLWACPGAMDAGVNEDECTGLEMAQAFCKSRGQSGALVLDQQTSEPDLRTGPAQPDVPVRTMDGSMCNATQCRVVVTAMYCDQ